MELINNLKDMMKNIDMLDEYIRNSETNKFALDLIKKGTCFVVIKKDEGYGFYPSRYIGYSNNNISNHTNNYSKDGRDTNPAISKIVGFKPTPSEVHEENYQKFCKALGFIAPDKGTAGAKHKYWLL